MSIKTLATAALAVSMALGSVTVAQASSPVPGKPGDSNLVETALAVNAATGEFDYLLAAATCEYFGGAVVALLSGEDKYTLFAPTDAAFENLTLNDNVGQTIGIQVDPGTGRPLANGNARNGVIHVIDTVRLPSLP